MVKLYKNFNINKNHKGSILLIGNFDGVHLGHQKLFKLAQSYKKKYNLKIGVINFDPMPKMFFNKSLKNFRLSSVNQKLNLLDNLGVDFIVTKNYLEEIINTLENNKDFIAASPKIIHGGLRHTIWWHGFKRSWSFLKFHRLMNLKKKRIIDDPSIKGIVETDAVCGCCSVYKSKGLLLAGLGDEDFFFGPEDMELSFRLNKFGRLIVNLNLKTFHKIVSSSMVSGWLSRSYYEAKGFLILIKKSGDFLDKIIGYPYFLLRIPYFLILLILKKREKDRVFGFCLGCYDFFFKKR